MNKVNEVVVGLNQFNQIVAPNPNVPTPAADPARFRLLLHVDGGGQVRLLKGVAILNKSQAVLRDGSSTTIPVSNLGPDTNTLSLAESNIVLLTDEALFSGFSGVAKRVASPTFDFGEGKAVEAINLIAQAAASAAAGFANANSSPSLSAIGTAATNSARSALDSADVDAIYRSFATNQIFRNGALGAASAAAAGVAPLRALGTNQFGPLFNAGLNAATNSSLFNTALGLARSRQTNSALGDTRYLATMDAVARAVADAAANTALANPTNAPGLSGILGAAATNAALAQIAAAINAPPLFSVQYTAFIAQPVFTNTVGGAAAAAAQAAFQARTAGGLPSQVSNSASSAATKAVAGALATADAITLNEVRMSGNLAAGQTVNGSIYLGARHPTNPFRHRRHPDHTEGYPVSRSITLEVGVPDNGPFEAAGFGVSRLRGIYKEEIEGLHKPLGPMQNIGLKVEGTFILHRITLIDTLNNFTSGQ